MSHEVLIHIETSIIGQTNFDNKKVLQDQQEGLSSIKALIIRRKLILHGGLAVNAVLPSNLKFYDENTVPDYDVLIADDSGRETKKLMYQAQKLLADKGYWAHFRPAVHENTQKLRAHPQGLSRLAMLRYPSVLDATSVSATDFAILQKLSTSEKSLVPADLKGMRLIPTAYMKLSFHLEFSRPSVHIQRWRKLYPRSVSLYKAHPFVVVGKPSPYTAKAYNPSGIENILNMLPEISLILVGEQIAMRIMGGSDDTIQKFGTLDVVTRDFETTHEKLTTTSTPPSSIIPESFFLPRHFMAGDCTVFAWEECTAYVRMNDDGLRFGNSDTVLRYLYGQYLQYKQPSIIDDLTAFQMMQPVSEITQQGVRSRFMTTCF
jgi:hypothetical protein